MLYDWQFPLNDHGVIGGLNESGVETFSGSAMRSLAREVLQNSMDARCDNNKPVIVEFSNFMLHKNCFPGHETLQDAMKKCHDRWRIQREQRTARFFKKAMDILSENYIDFLRISDFNTTGLTGSDEEFNSNWFNLVKGSGISDKAADAGGSFGIGKSAPFAVSDLRTVFYSTLDIKGMTAHQGVARLVSFQQDDQYTQGQGFYGDTNRNKPIYQPLQLDKDFLRTEPGTDIYIAGFRNNKGWIDDIIAAVLDGFLVAIHHGKLVVKIGDITIDQKTLEHVVSNITEMASNVHISEFYQVLTSPETQHLRRDFQGGTILLDILMEDSFHKKLAVTRSNGMILFKKDRLSPLIPFTGILSLEGNELNKLFRSMENPKHDNWEPERADDKTYAKTVYVDLFKTVKEMIRELEPTKEVDEMDAEGAGEYLPQVDNTGADKLEEKDKQPDPMHDFEFEIKEKKTDDQPDQFRGDVGSELFGDEEDLGENGGEGDEGKESKGKETASEGGDGAPGGGKKTDDGDDVVKKTVSVRLSQTRLIAKERKSGTFLLIFTADTEYKDAEIRLSYSGEQRNSDVSVVRASHNGSNLIVNRNKIKIPNLKAKEKYRIEIATEKNNYYPMEVKIDGIEVETVSIPSIISLFR